MFGHGEHAWGVLPEKRSGTSLMKWGFLRFDKTGRKIEAGHWNSLAWIIYLQADALPQKNGSSLSTLKQGFSLLMHSSNVWKSKHDEKGRWSCFLKECWGHRLKIDPWDDQVSSFSKKKKKKIISSAFQISPMQDWPRWMLMWHSSYCLRIGCSKSVKQVCQEDLEWYWCKVEGLRWTCVVPTKWAEGYFCACLELRRGAFLTNEPRTMHALDTFDTDHKKFVKIIWNHTL